MAQGSAVVRLALYGAVHCLAGASSRAQAEFAASSTESTLAIHSEGITLMDQGRQFGFLGERVNVLELNLDLDQKRPMKR